MKNSLNSKIRILVMYLLAGATLLTISSCTPRIYPGERRDTKYVKLLKILQENEPEIIIQQKQDTLIKTDLSHLNKAVLEMVTRHPELKDTCELLVSIVKNESQTTNSVHLENLVAKIEKDDSLSSLDEYLVLTKIALLSRGDCLVSVNTEVAKQVRITSHVLNLPLGNIGGQKAFLHGMTIIYAINGDEIFRVSNTDKKMI